MPETRCRAKDAGVSVAPPRVGWNSEACETQRETAGSALGEETVFREVQRQKPDTQPGA